MSENRGNLRFFELLVSSSALIGGAIYGGLRLALADLYRPFGVTPEEVGWDLTTTLARFTALILIAAFGLPYGLALTFLYRSSLRKGSKTVITVAVALITIASVVVLLALFIPSARDRLEAGKPLYGSSFLPISAPCVNAQWVEADKAPTGANAPKFDSATKYILLGQNDKYVVLLRTDRPESLRIPTDLVILTECHSF